MNLGGGKGYSLSLGWQKTLIVIRMVPEDAPEPPNAEMAGRNFCGRHDLLMRHG